MIGPYFDGGWALDLYAGTGGLGIEALSRGFERAVFTDNDPKAVTVIRQNLASLGLTERAEVYRNDAARALKALAKRQARFDLVFLDPPYAQQRIAEEIGALQEAGLLRDGAWIVAEHDAAVVLPEAIGGCAIDRSAVYGDTRISLYRFSHEGG